MTSSSSARPARPIALDLEGNPARPVQSFCSRCGAPVFWADCGALGRVMFERDYSERARWALVMRGWRVFALPKSQAPKGLPLYSPHLAYCE